MNRAIRGKVAAALYAALCACALPARAGAPDLVIEAELVPERVYVGGEARLRLRLHRAPGVTQGVLRAPALGEAAELSVLGPINLYQVQRAGVTYEVLERTHVIVPRRAGRLVVPGTEFEGALNYAEVFGRDSGTSSVPRKLRGPQLELEVLPIPQGAAEPWLPARNFRLEETWSRDLDALSAGTPVTRTLTLRAEGIAAERLPRLEMPAHPALYAHYDQPEIVTEYLATGMSARRVQRIVLMPIAAAEVALPALSVLWWDVEADAPRSATLAARTLRLQSTIAPTAVPRPAPAAPAAPTLMRFLPLAVLLIGAAVTWWLHRTRAWRLVRAQLRESCRRNDPRAARTALSDWSKALQTGATEALPLPLHRLGAGWPEAARAQLAGLDAALYGGLAWDGAAFWRHVRPCLRKTDARRTATASPLPPLFRLQSRSGQR